MDELTGVILSAGKGTRIDPFNARYPKPLLPIGNEPVIGHHLRVFRELGIRRVHIVVGHMMDQIIGHFGRGRDLGLEIHYVEQQQILGIAHAVGQVERHVDGPFLLALGDIFYLAPRISRLVDRFRQGDVEAVLAVKDEPDPGAVRKNFTVETDEDGYVRRVIEKPRNPTCRLKGCGIYLFGPAVFDAIHSTPRTALRDEYEITNTIQILIDDGHRVVAEPVVEWDLNVTFPGDLLEGNLRWLETAGLTNHGDPTARVHPEAVLDRCVIGARCEVPSGAHLHECVMLPDTLVPEGADHRRMILSREFEIRC